MKWLTYGIQGTMSIGYVNQLLQGYFHPNKTRCIGQFELFKVNMMLRVKFINNL